MTEERRCAIWRMTGGAGAAAGAAGPAGGPPAAAVVVPVRYRHLVGAGLRGPLQLAVPSPRGSDLALPDRRSGRGLPAAVVPGPGHRRRLPFRNLRYGPGRPVGIASLVAWFAAAETEFLLIGRGLPAAAIVVAALGVAVEMALLQAALRVSRRELRGGGGTGMTAKPDPLIHPITRLSICGCWRPARTGSSSPRCAMRPGSATRCCRNSHGCSKTPGTWKSARARSAGGRAPGSG